MKINRRDFNRLSSGLLLGAGGLLTGTGRALAGDTSYVVRHGHAPFYASHLYPGSPLTLSERALQETGQKVLALTFDDGPVLGNDTEILRLLTEYDAVATFFVIGNKIPHHLELLQQMVNNGSEVGNHSWRHPMMTSLNADSQLDELRQTDDMLAGAGIPVKWFRPPYGDYDTLTTTIARTEALETILWSVDSRDWKGSPPDVLAQRVIADISPGAVILMHSTKSHTVAALPKILQYARANGYRFVTMSEWKQIMIRVDPIAVRMAAESKPSAAPEAAKIAEMPRAEMIKTMR
ncbi:MAG: polysaccharide deacetylase family protein [Rhodospirillaceae bacterium]